MRACYRGVAAGAALLAAQPASADTVCEWMDLAGRLGAAAQGAPSCNGWTFWHVEQAGGLVVLDALRQKYILALE